MKFSASQAAKAVGKSLPTITRAIKNGKISAERTQEGGFEIDASELYRVWPDAKHERVSNAEMLGSETHSSNTGLHLEVVHLRQKIETLTLERERERAQLLETIEDLRRRLDSESTERRAMLAQLTDQRGKKGEASRRGWLARLLGG